MSLVRLDRRRPLSAGTRRAVATWLAIAAVTLSASASTGHERSRLACAAFDLHALGQVEEAGSAPGVASEALLAAVEAMLAARRACQAGAFDEGLLIYQSIDIGIEQVRWLR